MNKIIKVSITAMAALSMWACVDNANSNKPANATNSNANATASKAAPSAETLLAMDKQANEAYFKGDTAFFDGFLSDKTVMYDGKDRYDKAAALKMIGSAKCDMKSWNIEDPQVSMIDADTYVLSYKGTYDGTCTEGGKSMKAPSPIRAATVYVRNGEKWQAAFHGENMIIDPKNPPAPPAKTEPSKADTSNANNSASNANSTSAESAPKATADANSDTLTKIHNSGWEAWKAKDAKKFDELLASNFAFLDPAGVWHGNKAETIKFWTEGMKCEGVNNVKFGPGFATPLSPTIEILTGNGTADGTCDGQKNGELSTTAFYVKDGDTWKLAFMMESIPHAGM